MHVNKRVFGGAPPGSGIKTDLMLLFDEIQTAKQTLESIESLRDTMEREAAKEPVLYEPRPVANRPRISDDEYMTSAKWLERNGLAAQSLEIFHVLNRVCFRH